MAAAKVSRDMSVHFYTRGLPRLSHTEVLDALDASINREHLQAIQITTTECFLTVNNRDIKHRLLIDGVDIRDRHFDVHDVEKAITHVTLKDLPVELDDSFVVTNMLCYGVVVDGSIRRGTIKGTQIQTGTRYLNLTNCTSVIPNTTQFGDHEVRLFADNNKTECKYCESTEHPHYRCPNRPAPRTKRCFRCNGGDHLIRECRVTNDQVDRQELGVYYNDVMEGRRSADNHSPPNHWPSLATVDSDNRPLGHLFGSTQHQTDGVVHTGPPQHQSTPAYISPGHIPGVTSLPPPSVRAVILGASNCNRCPELADDSMIKMISVSGATAHGVDTLLDKAVQHDAIKRESIRKVVLCLGTNDVTHNRDDPDQVIINLQKAAETVVDCFPRATVAISSILPRRGKSHNIERANETIKQVNEFMKKWSKRSTNTEYIDHDILFAPSSTPLKPLYDITDSSGIHISPTGAEKLMSSLVDCATAVSVQDMTIVSNKRNRSQVSLGTPDSVDRKGGKITKS
jgi:lysophospholipase L1-like esterase